MTKRKPKIIKDKKERGEWAESVFYGAGGGIRFAGEQASWRFEEF